MGGSCGCPNGNLPGTYQRVRAHISGRSWSSWQHRLGGTRPAGNFTKAKTQNSMTTTLPSANALPNMSDVKDVGVPPVPHASTAANLEA